MSTVLTKVRFLMSWYDTIATVKVGGSDGPRFEVGNYRLALLSLKEHKAEQGEYCIPEFVILATDSKMPVGTEAGYAIRLDAKFKSHAEKALGEVKGVIAAAMGLPEDSQEAMEGITPGVIHALLNNKPFPLRGYTLNATAYMKPPSQKAREKDPNAQPFMKMKFSCVEPGKTIIHPLPAAVSAPVAATVTVPGAPNPLSLGGPPPLPGGAPPLPGTPPPLPVFPPTGWQVHPQDASLYWKGTELKTRPELEALALAGRA